MLRRSLSVSISKECGISLEKAKVKASFRTFCIYASSGGKTQQQRGRGRLSFRHHYHHHQIIRFNHINVAVAEEAAETMNFNQNPDLSSSSAVAAAAASRTDSGSALGPTSPSSHNHDSNGKYIHSANPRSTLRNTNTPEEEETNDNKSSLAKGPHQHHHDTHATPPEAIFHAHNKYNRMSLPALDADPDVIDFNRGLSPAQKAGLRLVKVVPKAAIGEAGRVFREFGAGEGYSGQDGGGVEKYGGEAEVVEGGCHVYEPVGFPGLWIYPSLVPPETQVLLLSRLMHRDLSNPAHKTNINLEYDVPWPPFFDSPSSSYPTLRIENDPSSPSLPSASASSRQSNLVHLQRRSFFSQPLTSKTKAGMFVPKSSGAMADGSDEGQKKSKKQQQPLTLEHVLRKKLRYLTLGAQYDWSTRNYPAAPPPPPPATADSSSSDTVNGADNTNTNGSSLSSRPPPLTTEPETKEQETTTTIFPPDIGALVTSLFPTLRSESGVVLFYNSKDYMPPHRDVSEVAETGLASFTLGCEGVFVVLAPSGSSSDDSSTATSPPPDEAEEGGAGKADESKSKEEERILAIRVRSGDVIQMSAATRWAWHAMPRIIPGTCPEFLAEWPAGSEGLVGEERGEEGGEGGGVFEQWRGYMRSMRVNISVRQVWK